MAGTRKSQYGAEFKAGTTWVTSVFVDEKEVDVSVADPDKRIETIDRALDSQLSIVMKNGKRYSLGYEEEAKGLVMRDPSIKPSKEDPDKNVIAEYSIKRSLFGSPTELVERIPAPANVPFALKEVTIGDKTLALAPAAPAKGEAEYARAQAAPTKQPEEKRAPAEERTPLFMGIPTAAATKAQPAKEEKAFGSIPGVTWVNSVFEKDKAVEVELYDRNKMVKNIYPTEDGSLRIAMNDGNQYFLRYEKKTGLVMRDSSNNLVAEYGIERSLFGSPKKLVENVEPPPWVPLALKQVRIGDKTLELPPRPTHEELLAQRGQKGKERA